ncbi:lytic transglycosylase domain-containing protein [Sporosarcina sp. ITBMC105]
MDARAIRSLLDIQSMQTLGAVQSQSINYETSLFSTMLSEVLNATSNDNLQSNYFQHNAFGLSGSLQTFENLRYRNPEAVYMPAVLNGLERYTNYSVHVDMQTTMTDNQFTHVIRQAADAYNLPEQLISSVIRQESNFNPDAISHAGATGLMQLMPGTAKYLGVKNSFDPEQNIMGGAKYLRQMLNQFGDVELALAAYNAGPGNVKKYGGIPPFKETQRYVATVLNYYNRSIG